MDMPEMRLLLEYLGFPLQRVADDFVEKLVYEAHGGFIARETVELDLPEFMYCMRLAHEEMEALYREYFDHFDMDSSGSLNLAEIKALAWEIGYYVTQECLMEAVRFVRPVGSETMADLEFYEFVEFT